MPFATRAEGPNTVLCLCGEIDIHRAGPARRQILDLVRSGHALVVDLSDVSYLDSAGVAAVVEGYQCARDRGLSFALAGVGKSAMKLLQLTRLDAVLPIHSAVAHCPQGGEADGDTARE